MAKDIEKIIEDSVVPEMEYVKTKQKSAEREVPEVVLPKTKAEMYREAKGRLGQKTSAVSKAYDTGKRNGKQSKKQTGKSTDIKTVELETVAAADLPTAKTRDRTATSARTTDYGRSVTYSRTNTYERFETSERTTTYERAMLSRRICNEPKWVGSADELVPFAWRKPLIQNVAKPSRFYRAAVRDGKAVMLPAPRDK